jgi:hypothetical protein
MFSLIVTAKERRRSAGVAHGYPCPPRPPPGSSGWTNYCPGILHVNKIDHVTTITRVAADLGEDEDWLREVAREMETEDGIIWVCGVGEDGIPAFTDFGIENLIELVRMYKKIRLGSSADR